MIDRDTSDKIYGIIIDVLANELDDMADLYGPLTVEILEKEHVALVLADQIMKRIEGL